MFSALCTTRVKQLLPKLDEARHRLFVARASPARFALLVEVKPASRPRSSPSCSNALLRTSALRKCVASPAQVTSPVRRGVVA